MSLCLLAVLTGCESDDQETSGIGSSAVQAGTAAVPIEKEPAMRSRAEKSAKKLFAEGVWYFRRRQFPLAASRLSEAERRHRMRAGGSERDEFLNGCAFYLARCREVEFAFDAARELYDQIPPDSAYRPATESRIAALDTDSDGDGYADAWEEAEGSNPSNPLSHP